jgi:hypothetical protein
MEKNTFTINVSIKGKEETLTVIPYKITGRAENAFNIKKGEENIGNVAHNEESGDWNLIDGDIDSDLVARIGAEIDEHFL